MAVTQIFGVGQIWATPTYDATGTAITNPTPIQFGTVQDVSLSLSWELKKLYGSLDFPVAIGRGQGSVTGSLSAAKINFAALNFVMSGTAATGIVDTYDHAAAIPTTPFTITPTIPGGGTFDADLGVLNVTTGRQMTRVASAPATGQYSLAAGVYTFAAADTTQSVVISVRYTATTANTQKTTVSARMMGTAPTFGVDWNMQYMDRVVHYRLHNVTFPKFDFSAKSNDFTIPKLDFEAAADASGQVLTASSTD